ncbi:alpha/beta hydrolase family protein [Chloroflexota bacterium]
MATPKLYAGIIVLRTVVFLFSACTPATTLPAPSPDTIQATTAPTPPPDTTPVEANAEHHLYKLALGAHKVLSKSDIVLTDSIRNKDLQIRITWPESPGNFPVIVWSHGLGGNNDLNKPLVHHWVSHGYVCIQMNHSDSLHLTRNPSTLGWRNRPEDIKFVLNSLEAIASAAGIMDKLDQSNIGMGGHSFGAHTTQLIGGALTNRLNGSQESHADPRPAALLMISPQGT